MPKVGLRVAYNRDIQGSECCSGHTARERKYILPTKAIEYMTKIELNIEVLSYNSRFCPWLYKKSDDNSMR
jgi:hypothetical protein